MRLSLVLLTLLVSRTIAAPPVSDPEREYLKAINAAQNKYLGRISEKLARADRVEVVSLTTDEPKETAENWRETGYGYSYWVHEKVNLQGRDAAGWIASFHAILGKPILNGVLCHDPAYGVRFWSGDTLLLQSSVCFDCGNLSLPSGPYAEALFKISDPALKGLCARLLPLPPKATTDPRPHQEREHRMAAGDLPLHALLPARPGMRWIYEMTTTFPNGSRSRRQVERRWLEDSYEYRGQSYQFVLSEGQKAMVRTDQATTYSLDDLDRGEQTEVRFDAGVGNTWARWFHGLFFTDKVASVESCRVGDTTYEKCLHIESEAPDHLCAEEYWISSEVGLVRSVITYQNGFRTVTVLQQVQGR